MMVEFVYTDVADHAVLSGYAGLNFAFWAKVVYVYAGFHDCLELYGKFY